jgi:hypothetical protein
MCKQSSIWSCASCSNEVHERRARSATACMHHQRRKQPAWFDQLMFMQGYICDSGGETMVRLLLPFERALSVAYHPCANSIVMKTHRGQHSRACSIKALDVNPVCASLSLFVLRLALCSHLWAHALWPFTTKLNHRIAPTNCRDRCHRHDRCNGPKLCAHCLCRRFQYGIRRSPTTKGFFYDWLLHRRRF